MTYYDINGMPITEEQFFAGQQNTGSAAPDGTVSYYRKTSYTGAPGETYDSGDKYANVGTPESYRPGILGAAGEKYEPGDKYAGVGTPESYAPDYSLNYQPTVAGQAYIKAMQKIGNELGDKPTYDNKYDKQLEDAYLGIVNRKPFSWDAETDPFYNQYKQRYTELGQQAMKDTMGQAAALTGGYGNTYAQSAGQSAYNRYMDALADKSIQLEERAYQRYQDAGDELYRQYNLLGNLRDTEYGKYRDAVSDYNYNLALLQAQEAEDYGRAQYLNQLRIASEQEGYGRYRDSMTDARYEDELSYNRWRDSMADARYEDEVGYDRWRNSMADARYEDELGYNRWRDIVSDRRYEDEWAYQQQRDAIADQQWAQEFALKQAAAAGAGSGGGRSGGGGSSGGGGYSSGSYEDEYSGTPEWYSNMGDYQTAELQRQLNAMGADLDEDGIWGPKTQAAYEQFMGSSGPATYITSGNNGYDYSLNGYTGEKIYSSLAEEAKQAAYEDAMQSAYVNVIKEQSSGPKKKSTTTHSR